MADFSLSDSFWPTRGNWMATSMIRSPLEPGAMLLPRLGIPSPANRILCPGSITTWLLTFNFRPSKVAIVLRAGKFLNKK
jgi:hypothetical protein